MRLSGHLTTVQGEKAAIETKSFCCHSLSSVFLVTLGTLFVKPVDEVVKEKCSLSCGFE